MGLISNGTTLLDAGVIDSGIAQGPMQLITTLTASSSATLDFTSGISSTYEEYVFVFFNLHPADNGVEFEFQGNAAGASGFNETITSSLFKAGHGEDGSGDSLNYETGHEQSQGTGFQDIARYVGNGNDESVCGTLTLYDPSSTAFVKHFIARTQMYHASNEAEDCFTAGYFNTTAAIDEIQFKFSAGNIDTGTIKMYGIK